MERWSNVSNEDIRSGKYVFRDIFDVYDYLHIKSGWSFGWYAAPNFEIMQLEANRLVAAPMPMFPLFRGQNLFHSPSYPSLYRKEMSELDLIERDIKFEDFKTILDKNPEIKDLKDNGLVVNYTGLAQHYGIDTNIMDLTNSFGVAAFFATTYYDLITNCYIPIPWSITKGVIYFMPTGGFLSNLDRNRKDYILPIGMEALARPGEQRAYGAELRKGEDFNAICPIRFFFWQNPQASKKCYDYFDEGKLLLPYDPMAEKIREMSKYRMYGEDSLQKVIHSSKYDVSYEFAKKALEERGCHFYSTSPFKYTDSELEYIIKNYHKKYPGSFPDSHRE